MTNETPFGGLKDFKIEPFETPSRTSACFGWAVWDYQGGFAVRDQDGNPTPILKGLFLSKSRAGDKEE